MLARWLAQGGRQASCRCLHASAELLAAPSGQMQSIKSLRELSGAPIADVKAALVEAGWDAGECAGRLAGLAGTQSKLTAACRREGIPGAAQEGPRCRAEEGVAAGRFARLMACQQWLEAVLVSLQAARTALEGLVCVATRESEAAVVEVRPLRSVWPTAWITISVPQVRVRRSTRKRTLPRAAQSFLSCCRG